MLAAIAVALVCARVDAQTPEPGRCSEAPCGSSDELPLLQVSKVNRVVELVDNAYGYEGDCDDGRCPR